MHFLIFDLEDSNQYVESYASPYFTAHCCGSQGVRRTAGLQPERRVLAGGCVCLRYTVERVGLRCLIV